VQIVETVHRTQASGSVSAHSLVEVYSTLTRLPRSPRIPPQEAALLIQENILKHFSVVAITGKEYADFVLDSAKLGLVGGQIYDALILRCAEKSGAERIYTFNVRHFQSLASSSIAPRIVVP
jgi:predicted nucleic acid-binding protein